MSIITTDSKHYNDIGSILLAKTRKRYKPADMAEGIAEVYAIGREEGVEDGKQAERDAFWDAFQDNGNRRNYDYAFQRNGFPDSIYNPKYPIMATDAVSMFWWANFLTDIKVPCEFIGGASLQYTFGNCHALVRIPKMTVAEATTYTNTFLGCSNLEILIVDGIIGKNGFNVSPCTKLTHDSLMSVINALKNYAGSGVTYTVTLGATNLAKLTAAEKAIATQKGWTLA